jgi:hypothetical protein
MYELEPSPGRKLLPEKTGVPTNDMLSPEEIRREFTLLSGMLKGLGIRGESREKRRSLIEKIDYILHRAVQINLVPPAELDGEDVQMFLRAEAIAEVSRRNLSR